MFRLLGKPLKCKCIMHKNVRKQFEQINLTANVSIVETLISPYIPCHPFV